MGKVAQCVLIHWMSAHVQAWLIKKQKDCQGIFKIKFLKFLDMQGKIYIVSKDAFLCLFFH